MMRVDLLRSLPPTRTPAAPAPGPGPGKRLLAVLLLLVLAGLAIWLARPEWVSGRVAAAWHSLTSGGEQARADSLQRADAVARQASRQIDARQAAVIEWLYHLELLQPEPPVASGAGATTKAVPVSPGSSTSSILSTAPVSFTYSTFTASGEFLLEGRAASAEALSALQEALVLIPGMDLRESHAVEAEGSRGPAFDFRFAGFVTFTPVEDGGPIEAMDTGATTRSAGSPVTAPVTGQALAPVAGNRVADAAALPARLEGFLRAAGARGLRFAAPEAGPVTRAGALQAHPWRVRGDFEGPDATGRSALVSLRDLLEHERHDGSPFAIQRVTLNSRHADLMVFLDILALSP